MSATVFIRHFTTDEVLARQRAQSNRDVSRHNAGIVERLELAPRPSVRDQVLEQFDSKTRRWCR